MATSGGKASFIDLEAGYPPFQVQYNPKEFKADKAVSWKEHDDQGQTLPNLEFQKGAPMVVSMDLYFDTTNEENSDVRTKWVNGLLCLTNAVVKLSEGSTDKKRPPKVKFTWGSFQLTAVVESVNVTYLMFGSDGTPIRARCALKMKEWAPGEVEAHLPRDTVKLVTAGSGATASSVALANNTTTKQIMEDNDIEDGTEIPAGTQLIIKDAKSAASKVTSNRSSKDESKSPWAEIQDALKEAEKTVGKAKDSAERILGSGDGKKGSKDRGGSSGGSKGSRGGSKGGRSGGGRAGGSKGGRSGGGSGRGGAGGAKGERGGGGSKGPKAGGASKGPKAGGSKGVGSKGGAKGGSKGGGSKGGGSKGGAKAKAEADAGSKGGGSKGGGSKGGGSKGGGSKGGGSKGGAKAGGKPSSPKSGR